MVRSAYNEFVLRNHPNKDLINIFSDMVDAFIVAPRDLRSEEAIVELTEKLNSCWREQRRLFIEGITPEVKRDIEHANILLSVSIKLN